jgi:hypothetical protein
MTMAETTSILASRSRLNARQVETYRTEGYLIYPDSIFPAAKFEALKAHFEQKLSNLAADVRPESMDVPHFADPKLFEWLFADEVLSIVEPILGPDIALFSSHFICKPRGNGKRVPWHEDSFYWKGMLAPMEVVTIWLAIDPSTKENGCMKVIPRTFHGDSEYEPVDAMTHVFDTEIKKKQRDESKAVAIELEPNHASLHDGRLMHGSDANTSSKRRCGYTMRYVSAATKLAEDRLSHHHFYLARGQDRAGNQYGDPTKSYEHLARYREAHHKGGH